MNNLALDFEQAKSKHLLFKSKLRSILYDIAVDEGPVLSHHECSVGKWIYGHALQAYGHIPEMLELEMIHADIHTSARKLVALHKEGKTLEAKKGLSEMEQIADKLVGLLGVVELKIESEPFKESGFHSLNFKYEEYYELLRSNAELDKRIKLQIEETNASSLRYEAVLAALSEGIFIQDANGVLQSANHSAELLLGMSIDQMRGMTSMDPKWRTIYEDGRPMPGEEHPSMLALRSGRPIINQLMGIYKSDGSLVWLNVNAQPLVSKETGEITGVVSSSFDVTAIRNAEEEIKISLNEQRALNEELAASNEELAATNEELAIAQRDLQGLFSDLSESEERFRTMAEDTDVLIAVTDEKGNGVYFNKAWQELTGRSMEELVSPGWAGLIHPEDKERCINTYLTAFYKQVSLNGEFRVLSKSGDYRWLLAKIPARFRPDGSFAGYISSCTDITDLKNEEQRKNDFIDMVSHELKTPLTSLSANLQVLQNKLQNAEDTFATTALNKANKQVKKMKAMINGFLNIARLEAGKIYLEMENFDLAALISEVKDEIGFTTNTHRIGFTFDGSLNVYADREKIGQVLNNLLNNAIKYSPKGTDIEITCSKGIGYVQVSIKDEGFGIKPNHIPQLFERFYRVENKDTKHISGFGIGLYLCAEIINRHNGKIWVDSAEDKGSNFHFSLPLNLNK